MLGIELIAVATVVLGVEHLLENKTNRLALQLFAVKLYLAFAIYNFGSVKLFNFGQAHNGVDQRGAVFQWLTFAPHKVDT
ncbi:hypothetical protein D3C79_790510 [compost metagenome]